MGDYEKVKASADLKEYAAQYLTPGRERGTYVCPLCGSGTGKNNSHTADFKIMPDGAKWHCFACNKTGDVFDLAGVLNNTTDRAEQLRIVAEWARVPIGEGTAGEARGFQATMNARRATETATAPQETETGTDTPKTDYTAGRERHRAYIAECAERLRDMPAFDETRMEVIAYLSERGISEADAVTLGIGYDPEPAHGWQDEAGEWHNTPRIVLPWAGSDYYHIDRAINERAKDLKYDKPPAKEVGEQPLYNPQAFDHDYIFVVEGVLDAIALHLCGFNAVALGGVGANDFVNEAARRNYAGASVDMLDADERGRQAGKDLAALSAEAGLVFLARDGYGVADGCKYGQVGTAEEGYKDAGEWLASEPRYMTDFMGWAVKTAREKVKRENEAGYREAMRHLNAKDPAGVALDVLEMRDVYEPVPTGINALDEVLGGGVALGETTFFGAVSSYGKTTLAVQIADYMASAGRSVLFVTIEQSAREIVAKSLSRLVYTENETGWNIATPQEITSLRARRAWGDGQLETLQRAVDDYRRMIAPNMRILEGNEQPTVNDIRAIAQVMAEHDGSAPIVFIDYLQLLAPLSERFDTDKRNADRNVSELRKMARDLKTHVWCISSLNRSSYSGVISLDSFKESGMIEYGADNLLGLQPRDMAGQLESVSEQKQKRAAEKIVKDNKAKHERDCELVVLKQRNGALPDAPMPITFKPMAAYFSEPTARRDDTPARRVI